MIKVNADDFERFIPPGSGSGPRGVAWPRVSITASGKFSFNKAAQDALGNPEHVGYLYDRQRNKIAFVKVGAHSPAAYKMNGFGPGIPTAATFGKSFLDHYDIPYGPKSRAYLGTPQDGMLVIDLDDPFPGSP